MDQPRPQPQPIRLEPVPGGRLPEVGALFSATMNEFMANLGPYALAGVGLFLVGMMLAFVMIPLIYLAMTGVMVFGLLGSVFLGVGVSELSGSEDAGAFAMMLGYLGSFGLMFTAMFAVIGFMGAVTAPFQASLTRAVAAHQRGEGKLEIGAAFGTATQDLGSVVVVAALYMTAIVIGSMACYLPAFFVMALASMAPTMVYLHREGAGSALTLSTRHAMANLGFYVPLALVLFLSAMISAYVPVIGPMFGVALHVRAYREMFGDGPEPVLG
jgi:uncharacterized membrane protein